MGESYLLDDRAYVGVDHEATPDGVGGTGLGVGQRRVALGEGEVERVADGDRQSGED